MVYFTCVESQQNVAKYVDTSRVAVSLEALDGELRMTSAPGAGTVAGRILVALSEEASR